MVSTIQPLGQQMYMQCNRILQLIMQQLVVFGNSYCSVDLNPNPNLPGPSEERLHRDPIRVDFP